MGIYAAKSAVIAAARSGLSDRSARLLVFMALECWDDEENPGRQPAKRYFGRREASAIALGFAAPDNGSEAAFTAVKRAVRELLDAGFIERVRTGGNGLPAEFEIRLSTGAPRRSIRGPHPVIDLRATRDQGVF